MTMISEWVMQIIVFILIATVIELLVPNNAMKKYINIVIGLLLLVVLAKPIFYILQVDMTSELNRVEQTLFQTNRPMSETENLIESQKKDIQAEQAAYIWSEVKTQLMNEANPSLNEAYDAQIVDISFIFNDDMSDNFDNLKKIVVTMNATNENIPKNELIEPVNVDMEEPKPIHTKRSENNRIKTTLEETWDVNKALIEIVWEGGTFD